MKSVGLSVAYSAANDLNPVAKLRVVMSTSSQNSERKYEWQPQLEEYAAHLNAIDKPAEHEKIFYDNLSGALVWSDETNEDTPSKVISALRLVRAYRTSLMLGKPRVELEFVWRRSLLLFPNWVGFRAERCESSKRLLKIYRHGNIRLIRCLREMEEEMDIEL